MKDEEKIKGEEKLMDEGKMEEGHLQSDRLKLKEERKARKREKRANKRTEREKLIEQNKQLLQLKPQGANVTVITREFLEWNNISSPLGISNRHLGSSERQKVHKIRQTFSNNDEFPSLSSVVKRNTDNKNVLMQDKRGELEQHGIQQNRVEHRRGESSRVEQYRVEESGIVQSKTEESKVTQHDVPLQPLEEENRYFQTDKKGSDKTAKVGNFKPKSRDPININLLEVVKLEQQPRLQSPKEIKKNLVTVYAGNQLDSKHPERKMGKHREIPKKKRPTTLKQRILSERKEGAYFKNHMVPEGNENEPRGSQVESQGSQVECEGYLIGLQGSQVGIRGSQVETQGSQLQPHGNQFEAQGNQIECQERQVKPRVNRAEPLASQIEARVSQVEPQVFKVEHGEAQAVSQDTQFMPKNIQLMSNESKEKFVYFDNIITPELNDAAKGFVAQVVTLQEKLFHRDPVKGKIKRRYVLGFHETKKLIKAHRVKVLIIAFDVKVDETGVLHEIINDLLTLSKTHDVLYGFALKRRALGALTFKLIPVSCIGIINYEGAEVQFSEFNNQLSTAKEEHQRISKSEYDNSLDETLPLLNCLKQVLKLDQGTTD